MVLPSDSERKPGARERERERERERRERERERERELFIKKCTIYQKAAPRGEKRLLRFKVKPARAAERPTRPQGDDCPGSCRVQLSTQGRGGAGRGGGGGGGGSSSSSEGGERRGNGKGQERSESDTRGKQMELTRMLRTGLDMSGRHMYEKSLCVRCIKGG
ncbi:hypothetical protein R5R35_014583 [Gryllus longicercus]|uniref:Uncharacterized protein n=1 Tax=Gryllus longicercus TaxID=2509291 RepID=A0AAN9VBD4_9ORTH